VDCSVSEGIVVENGEKTFAALDCTAHAAINLSESPENGIPEDTQNFYIP